MRPQLLMIPGAFCGGWAFDELRPPLEAAGWSPRAIDLPGRGAGDAPPAWLSLADYASAVLDEIARSPSPPVLVGHSMGALVAQLAASRAAVAGLALFAPSPPWGQPVTSPAELAASPALAAMTGPYWLQTVEPDWPVVREYTLDRLPLAEARALHNRMVPESGRALYEVLNWWGDVSMAAYVPPLAVPALVISGALDQVNAPASGELTAQRLRAPHVTLPGVSHWTLGGPGAEAGVAALLEWLERLPGVS